MPVDISSFDVVSFNAWLQILSDHHLTLIPAIGPSRPKALGINTWNDLVAG